MMKKISAFLFTLLMLLALAAGAFAEEERHFDTEPGGFRITVPDEVKNAAGMLQFFPCTQYSYGTDIYITSFSYVAMTAEEYAAWQNSMSDPKLSDEELLRLQDQYGEAFAELFSVTASASPELAEFYYQTMLTRGTHPECTRIGEADGFVFDLYDCSPDYKENIDAWKAPFAEDFPRVHAALQDALTKADLFAPDTSDPFEGLQLSFETRDLDGNPVKSGELFRQNKITMLNIWATWCEPCKEELKALGEMDSRLQEQGCRLVGMLYDSGDEGAAQEGKALLKENGAEYLNLMFPEGFEEQLGKRLSLPTNLMVDSSGTVLCSIGGASIDAYEPVVQKLLAEK